MDDLQAFLICKALTFQQGLVTHAHLKSIFLCTAGEANEIAQLFEYLAGWRSELIRL